MKETVNANDKVVVQSVTLTVAEGNRLIVIGLAQYAPVREKLTNGVVVVCRGSTDTCLADELLKTNLAHGAFVTGRIQPEGSAPLPVEPSVGAIVLRKALTAVAKAQGELAF